MILFKPGRTWTEKEDLEDTVYLYAEIVLDFIFIESLGGKEVKKRESKTSGLLLFSGNVGGNSR